MEPPPRTASSALSFCVAPRKKSWERERWWFPIPLPWVCCLGVAHKREMFHGAACEYTDGGQFGDILVSYSCCNQFPQTRWLKTTRVYSLTVLGVRSPAWVTVGWNQDISRGARPLEVLGEICPLDFSCSQSYSLCIPELMAPYSIFKARNVAFYFSHQMPSSSPAAESPVFSL